MSLLVEGSLALVTGASSGIGRATCQVLAREGATVVVTCIDEANANETLKLLPGSDHCVFKYNVADYQSAQELLKTIVKKYNKPPNILVNCAGTFKSVPFLDETPETLQTVMDINFKGTFFTCQAVCRELIAAGSPGAVINVSSLLVPSGSPAMGAYAASKGAVEAFTRCLAKEMGQYNIRVNFIQPGVIDTQMSAGIPEDILEVWFRNVAIKRKGLPQEVAEMIAFLVSDRASYISSSCFPVSGGC